MSTLTVTAEALDNWTLLRVAGEIDLATGAVVRDQVHDAVAAGQRRILLDLSEVRFCDSTGVGVLIAARRLLRSCSGELRLVLPAARDNRGSSNSYNSEVHRVFNALGIRRLFDIHPDLVSASGPASCPVGSGGRSEVSSRVAE
ncbi:MULTISPECIES: STAS domain-containing protein [Streptacidiphilus]|uniref:Anti-sigma factor antagonist n=2 Tax=Streptacidiphilus TaxID=228398 RepID=A0ABV6UWY8_9ACTN|nr:STAS domain-containing protein [Streptacidiphilus jeojiense]